MRVSRNTRLAALLSSFGLVAVVAVIVAASGGGCSSDDNGAGGGGGGGAGGTPGAAGAGGGGPTNLTLTIAPLGTATLTGTAHFQKSGNQISLTVTVSGVTPVSAQHGIHIHANPDCGTASDGDGGTVNGGAAGGHWNPEGHDHGSSVEANHLGDIGNIMVDANGAGTLTFMTEHWEMGTGAANDILNHALVLHAGTDDGATQPTGNAGGRIGCVVIH